MQVLSMYHLWDRGTEEAWHWIWKIVEGAFVAHLKAAENNMKVLTDSWEHISKNHDIGQMSDKFFKLLFQRSPELQKMFVKPRKMMVVMFVKALDLIVRSVSDATVLDGDLKAVALRHIKYDIGPETLSVFGEVLIATLQDVVGVEKWDEETTEAWKDIYGNIAQVSPPLD